MQKVIWKCQGCGKTFEGTGEMPASCPLCGDDDSPEFKAVDAMEKPKAAVEEPGPVEKPTRKRR